LLFKHENLNPVRHVGFLEREKEREREGDVEGDSGGRGIEETAR
jgi:hypothetical protein